MPEHARLGPREIEYLRRLVERGHDRAAAPPTGEPSRVDWNLVLACGRRHRLNALLHWGSRTLPDAVPLAVRKRLERAFNVELARNVIHLHHLDELDQLARRADLASCLLKGSAFLTELYSNPGMRPMADIDLLVRPAELGRWSRELEHLGYRVKDVSDHAVAFSRPESGVVVELHRALTSCSGYLGVDPGELFERSRPAPRLAEGPTRTLAREDHLLHLCLHASFQHGFRQPAINAWDVHRIVSDPSFDRETFLERALRPKLARWVYGGLRLSELTFPGAAQRALRERLEPVVPRRLLERLASIRPQDLLAPEPGVVSGTPWRRLTWAGWSELSPIVRELTRGRAATPGLRRRAGLARILYLLWNHGATAIRFVSQKRWPARTGPSTASLEEVRDV